MLLLGFLFGVVCGWLLKFTYDFYTAFRTVEKDRADKLEEILINWRIMEKTDIKKGK
jgi:hypothetical protein